MHAKGENQETSNGELSGLPERREQTQGFAAIVDRERHGTRSGRAALAEGARGLPVRRREGALPDGHAARPAVQASEAREFGVEHEQISSLA